MKKRILSYRRRIDDLLDNEPTHTDWNKVLQEHLVQVAFFQHERLIHLIVTVTVAILTFISIAVMVIASFLQMIAVTLMLMVLLVPYIFHYFTLENEVQKMYEQYDRILEHCRMNL